MPGWWCRRCARSKNGWRPAAQGADLFYAYDTLGLRPDFVRDLAQQRGWVIEPEAEQEFERELERQRERARQSWKATAREAARPVYVRLAETFRTEPDFYYGTVARDWKILALVTEQCAVDQVPAGTDCEVILDRTSIYAE